MTSRAPIVTLSPRDYDAVLFDLDGVLTKTASVHAAAWKWPHSPNYGVRCVTTHRKPPEVRICRFRVEPQVTRTAPPQTRTSAINTSGSSESRFRCIDRVNNLDRWESISL